ncbi:uncharacterized protein BXZ73DRAFT_92267 [Epithele typhae]|uniref:uncharacterized protein n=1 Tax=Epithele typhae TaxID=378194 RepID=UPI0020084CA1|nr:uncharacterized protein BXZ73DRAFT_92267 [Epithele typhae]KAH9918207.1 hypothetical protein BXZ73DRAFT_92267 [Epithele typhae]
MPRFTPLHPRHVFLPLVFFMSSLALVHAQTLSTNMPVPPLQWIELTDLLGGTSPPPLKDASMGHDGANTLLIFGGESQTGVPTANTYALDLSNLQWSQPSAPSGLTSTPAARFAMVAGDDSAASYRNGHIVIDGEGASDSAAADIWEFDYTNKFWAAVNVAGNGPSSRWGGVGGIDPRVVDDALNNTLYMAGGASGSTIFDISEVWQLDVSGTLSSNIPKGVEASWKKVSVGTTVPGRVSMGGTVIGQQIVAVGGCTSASSVDAITSASCAVQDSQIIDATTGQVKNPHPCISARVDPVVVPNMNTASSSFSQQAFVLLGTFNSGRWDDGGGLTKGEVVSQIPPPRQGASALSWNGPLVGGSSMKVTDTIIFGGRDASGNYLSDIWILRAYNGTVTANGQKWTGYGSGSLTTGISADGQGVTISYMTECAVQLGGTSTTTTSQSSSPTPTGTGSGSSNPTSSASPSGIVYDTSALHKYLPAVSVALFLPAVAFYRLSERSGPTRPMGRHMGLMYLGVIVGAVAYALGIAGFVTAFTSISRSTPPLHLQTSHAKAVPVLQLVVLCLRRTSTKPLDPSDSRMRSDSAMEKMSVNGLGREGRRKARSWAGIGTWAGVPSRRSNETNVEGHPPSQRSFEVVNRGHRQRRSSGNSLAAFSDPRPTHTPRNLSDMSWLDARRSPGGMGGEGLSPTDRRDPPWTPGTTPMEIMSTNGLMLEQAPEHPVLPSAFEGFTHVLFHVLVFALTVLSLVALFQRGPIGAFAAFLAWSVIFYGILVGLSWNGRPNKSILSVIFSRLRHEPARFSPVPRPVSPAGSQPLSMNDSVTFPFPSDGRGPYQHHQPPYRTVHPGDRDYPTLTSHGHDLDVEDDDDEDEDSRQRRIEDELSRRDVAVVTVPKRRLYLLNPNPPEEEGS